jgi:gliding motility-associated-like protein
VVTVTDNQKPTITCPVNVNATTNTGCTATDVVLGTPLTGDNCGVKSVTNDAPTAFPLGVTVVTWTVTDNSNNKATCTQTVTVIDNVKPTITAPASVSVGTDPGKNTASSGVALGTPVTADNCTVASVTNDAPATYPLGNTTVTWTVTDGSGNTATATQIVTVSDKEKPIFTQCLSGSNQTVNTDTGIGITTYTHTGLSWDATSTDNDRLSTLVYNLTGATAGTGTSLNSVMFNVGATLVTWTATDVSGNISTCQFSVNVINSNLPPTAVDDQYTVEEGVQLTGDVRANDYDALVPRELLKVKLGESTAHGKLVLNDNGTFTYISDVDFVGTDHFTYELCKTIDNSSLCDQATVTITVTKNISCDFFIPNGFSPNGDGIDDLFKIRCLYNYPNAFIQIYTRSGIKVYEQKHYGNVDFWGSETDAWWDGRTTNKWNIGGSILQAATYIYILELEEGNRNNVKTGTVFLSR